MFSCEFCEISENTFFTEHLWTTASYILNEFLKFCSLKALFGLFIQVFIYLFIYWVIITFIKLFVHNINHLFMDFIYLLVQLLTYFLLIYLFIQLLFIHGTVKEWRHT